MPDDLAVFKAIYRRRPIEVQMGDHLVCTIVMRTVADDFGVDWRILASRHAPHDKMSIVCRTLQRITYGIIDLGPSAIGALYHRDHSTIAKNVDNYDIFLPGEERLLRECASRLNLKVQDRPNWLSLQRSPLLRRLQRGASWSDLLERQSEGIYSLPDSMQVTPVPANSPETYGSLMPYHPSNMSGIRPSTTSRKTK